VVFQNKIMPTDFNKMPPNSRIWIYQASTQLTDNQCFTIENYLKPLVEKWVAHGTALLASAKVLHNRFVIIALDESNYPASGCSIDASTHWLKELGAMMNIDFFDRSIAYLQNDEIKTVLPFQIKQKVQEGIISPETVVFLNSINSFSDLFKNWKNKAADTYLKKYFLVPVA
jgi:hypothetical protein